MIRIFVFCLSACLAIPSFGEDPDKKTIWVRGGGKLDQSAVTLTEAYEAFDLGEEIKGEGTDWRVVTVDRKGQILQRAEFGLANTHTYVDCFKGGGDRDCPKEPVNHRTVFKIKIKHSPSATHVKLFRGKKFIQKMKISPYGARERE